jgi:NAD(P)-dependent dehydrogenase (short-subunit alcohol dehydrogenase family)
MCQLALPHLAKTRGSIVNVSSVAGIRTSPNSAFYGSIKAALDAYTKCRAKTFGDAGVRMNGIKFVVFFEIFAKIILK